MFWNILRRFGVHSGTGWLRMQRGKLWERLAPKTIHTIWPGDMEGKYVAESCEPFGTVCVAGCCGFIGNVP
jgi:hypothetical protein